jgi:hypothetical protein
MSEGMRIEQAARFSNHSRVGVILIGRKNGNDGMFSASLVKTLHQEGISCLITTCDSYLPA